ncbi:MAG: protein SacA, partial [Bacilli bacterium]|nr:protein SacA [Bacilli bacterium]
LANDGSTPIGEISSKSYWCDNASLSFNKRGTYFFSGETHEAGKGTLTSDSFKVGGSGFMSFRMSGGRDPLAIYISIIDATSEEELLRFTNFMFNDLNTDLVGHGSFLMNMVLYKADLTSLLGRDVKIQVVDKATSNWGLVCVDSFITYYEDASTIDNSAILNPNTLAYKETASANQVLNGTFETGDLSGWTASNNEKPILGISRDYTWWNECYLYNKAGSFFASGWVTGEANTGTLTSSSFTLGGSGFITYRLGGGKNKTLCHVEFIDADTDEVLLTTYNQKFKEINKNYYYLGYPKDLAQDDVFAANMVEYKADLSAHIGKNIKIRLVDNAENDWGLLFADDFITYYENSSLIPNNYVLAEAI